ncbi:hypothetical protein IF1G_04567 [Cordyceps javanica]|uniref:Uncharacterized protein n=1 Tax=Cordyceps javanica TaxID=43265 RepID=A0A545V6I2_9HYPO|nr:hypothetical protein IF1G_04567 [Cordyceps javanica]
MLALIGNKLLTGQATQCMKKDTSSHTATCSILAATNLFIGREGTVKSAELSGTRIKAAPISHEQYYMQASVIDARYVRRLAVWPPRPLDGSQLPGLSLR